MSDANSADRKDTGAPDHKALELGRYALLERLERWLETPMLVFAFVWLALLVLELIWGGTTLFETDGTVIWIIFILSFALELTLAPHKLAFLKKKWLTALSLLVPALRGEIRALAQSGLNGL